MLNRNLEENCLKNVFTFSTKEQTILKDSDKEELLTLYERSKYVALTFTRHITAIAL